MQNSKTEMSGHRGRRDLSSFRERGPETLLKKFTIGYYSIRLVRYRVHSVSGRTGRVGRVARTLSYAEGAPSSVFEGGSWV